MCQFKATVLWNTYYCRLKHKAAPGINQKLGDKGSKNLFSVTERDLENWAVSGNLA
jgi:hypothetical protein